MPLDGRFHMGIMYLMSKTTIRVTMKNNSDARAFDLLDVLDSQCKHNGGKLVLCVVDSSDVGRAEELLEASHKVAEYVTCL